MRPINLDAQFGKFRIIRILRRSCLLSPSSRSHQPPRHLGTRRESRFFFILSPSKSRVIAGVVIRTLFVAVCPFSGRSLFAVFCMVQSHRFSCPALSVPTKNPPTLSTPKKLKAGCMMKVPHCQHGWLRQVPLPLLLLFLFSHTAVIAWSYHHAPWRPVSSFTGHALNVPSSIVCENDQNALVMRKQKASDKRTRRRQRGLLVSEEVVSGGGVATTTATKNATRITSPMQVQGDWDLKTTLSSSSTKLSNPISSTSGRGRSRKRSLLYTALASYHDKFLQLLQDEYQAEVSEPKCLTKR
jgi:hypothetical protein